MWNKKDNRKGEQGEEGEIIRLPHLALKSVYIFILVFRTFTKNSEKTQSSRKMPKVHALPITASSMEKVRDTSKFLRNDDEGLTGTNT